MNNKQMLNQPSEQLNALAHSFDHGLEIGQHYVKLLTKLAQTEDAHDLLTATNDLVNLDLILLYLFAKEKSRGSVSKHPIQKFPLIHFIRRHIPPDHLLGGGKSH